MRPTESGTTGSGICDCDEDLDSGGTVIVSGGKRGAEQDPHSLEFSDEHKSQTFGKKKWQPWAQQQQSALEEKVKLVGEMLEKYVCTPPSMITQTIHWVNHPKCYVISEASTEFKLALHNHKTRLANMTFDEFCAYYQPWKELLFRNCKYLPPDVSFKHAKAWIEQQAEHGWVTIPYETTVRREKRDAKFWVQKISNVVNRRERKRMALIMQGPNSCGKTWFTNMILDFYLNKGELNNWNRYENCSFPFMNLANARIGLWNEALLNGDGSQVEHLKVLFEGESKAVCVKNCKDATVMRVPLIVTTNNTTFEKSISFKDRQTVLTVEKVPLLTGGPNCPAAVSLHPFAWPMLVKHYKVETNEDNGDDHSAPKILSLAEYCAMEDIAINVNLEQ